MASLVDTSRADRLVDVAIVGAGSAGAAAARALACRGRSVVVVDQRPRGETGARWVNAVPAWMFAQARVPLPTGPELRSSGERYVLVDPSGAHRVDVARCPTLFFDMRGLIARLLDDAEAAGAKLRFSASVAGVLRTGDETVLSVRGADGTTSSVRARLVVDASGMHGAVRERVPALAAICPAVRGGDVCLAAQEVRAIDDVRGARAFLAREQLRSGEGLAVVGFAGGFSTRLVMVDLARGEVDLLAGAIAGRGRPSGRQILEELVAAEPWIGPRLFGGAGAIPLRRPYDVLGIPGVALLGDAASMVFPAHGSGVGAGLIAARILADAVGDHDPASAAVVRTYSRTFHRELGALLSAWDAFRKASQRLSPDDVTALVRAGFINETSASDSLAQRMPSLSARGVWHLSRAAVRSPRLARTMAPTVARMLSAYTASRRFPSHPWVARAVGRGIHRLVGPTPS